MPTADPDFVKKISTMTFEELTHCSNPKADPFPPVDDEFCESHVAPTPNGGDYSTAYFYDADGNPCRKQDAAYMNVVEFKRGGERVNESYGSIGGDEPE